MSKKRQTKQKKPERVRWDKYEVALLIDLYVSIAEKPRTERVEAIKQLSHRLRARAIRNGNRIDDRFRNVNGIAMRIENIRYLFCGRGLKDCSTLDRKMYDLYLKKHDEFDAILAEAISQTETEINEISESLPESTPLESASVREDDHVFQILRKYFPNGFKPHSIIDLRRFTNYLLEEYQESFEDDVALLSEIARVGVKRGDRVFAADCESKNSIINEVLELVLSLLNEGASCVSLEPIFSRYKRQLAIQLSIFSSSILAESVVSASNQVIVCDTQFYLLAGSKPRYRQDVANYLSVAAVPVSLNELYEKLWYLEPELVKTSCNTVKEIVRVATQTYVFAPVAPITQQELCTLQQAIDSELKARDYITDADLNQMAQKYCPALSANTSEYDSFGLRNVLSYYLGDLFSFNGTVIARQDEDHSVASIVEEYCAARDEVSLSDLKQLLTELGRTNLIWDQIFNHMIRISKERFVAAWKVHFDVPAIDEVLDVFCEKEYIPLKKISLFSQFPPIEFRWTKYLLESYVLCQSVNYQLLHSNFSETDCCGAIVKRNAGFNDFGLLLTDALANSSSWESKQDALEFLVSEGYLQRRSYRGIDEIVQAARSAREQMGSM